MSTKVHFAVDGRTACGIENNPQRKSSVRTTMSFRTMTCQLCRTVLRQDWCEQRWSDDRCPDRFVMERGARGYGLSSYASTFRRKVRHP